MDTKERVERVNPVTIEELRYYVEKGHRLRSEAIGEMLRTAGKALRRAFLVPPAVAHERRERARRCRRAWSGGGLSADGLPGGAR